LIKNQIKDYTKSLHLYREKEVLITNHPWPLLSASGGFAEEKTREGS
jgi:hypothetical protein